MASLNPENGLPIGPHVKAYFTASTRIDRAWDGTPLHNEFWRLYCNRRSCAWLEAEGRVFPMQANRLVLVPPRFRGRGRIEGSTEHAYAHFEIAGLPQELVCQLFREPFEVPASREVESLRCAWFRRLRRSESGAEIPSYFRIEALIAECVGAAWDHFAISNSPTWKAWAEGPPKFTRLQGWIEARLAEDLSVAAMARWSGCSTDHFRRIFQRVFGTNPSAYVTQARVKEGARLLLFSRLTIEDIAEKTGFVDRHHFSRVFRRTTGESPAAYRRVHPGCGLGEARR